METTAAVEKPPEQTESLRLVDLLNCVNSGHEVYFKHVRTAGDLMTTTVHKLNLDHKVKDAAQLMQEHGYHHAPVVDAESGEETMVGMISSRDVARQLSAGLGTAGEGETDQRMMESSLSSIMTRKPMTVAPDTSLWEVVGTMIEKKVDCLPVVRDGKTLTGILTVTDVSRILLHIEQLQKMSDHPERRRARLIDFESGRRSADSKMIVSTHLQAVGDVMSEKPTTVLPDAPLSEAINLMKRHRFRHLPVADASRTLLGLLSDVDVLHALPPAGERGPERGEGPPGFRDRLFAVDAADATLKSPVRLAMTPLNKLTPVGRGDRLTDTQRAMVQGRLSAVLVMDDPKKPRADGILTMTDFLRAVRVLCQVLKVSG
jgi:acetoin utilization protein AcuB